MTIRTRVTGPAQRPRVRALAGGVLAGAGLAITTVAGCGFAGAAQVSHTKPNGFVLRGHVSTPLPDGTTGPAGASCVAPTDLPDIAAGAPVVVRDPDGHQIAAGTLAAGVVAAGTAAASCDFPFEIAGVPGGVASYTISAGHQPARTFPAQPLREDEPAVLDLAS